MAKGKRPRRQKRPRLEEKQENTLRPVEVFLELKNMQIAVWYPDAEGRSPPEQVHLMFQIDGVKSGSPTLDGIKLGARFHSPETLSALIRELIEYRREVWRDAPPVPGEILTQNN